jgi:uncharacterized protein (DUF4415 family)
MKNITEGLTAIAKSVKVSTDAAAAEQAIKSARAAVESAKKSAKTETAAMLEKLENELKTWQSKLNVILREPVGRQGMAKHVDFWIQELKKAV